MKKKLSISIPSILASSFSNALMATCIKITLERGLAILTIIFWRGLVGLILLFCWTLFRHQSFAITKQLKQKFWVLHAIRNLSGLLALFAFFYSLKDLSVAKATLLFFTTPLFMPLVAYLWEGKKIPLKAWGGILVGFIGVVLVLHPGAGIFKFSSLYALASGILTAISQYAIHLLHEEEDTKAITFYYFTFVTLVAGLLSLFFPVKFWQGLTTTDLFFLFFIGFAGFLYQMLMVFALKYSPPVLISPFLYTVVLFAAAVDWILWKETISLLTFLGFLLVIAGVIIKVLYYPPDKKS